MTDTTSEYPVSGKTVILDRTIPASLEMLIERFSKQGERMTSLDIWAFDGPDRRRRAEQAFARQGVSAKIRSTYKPLVHAFLEEIDLTGVERIRVRYPVISGAEANRFLLEADPLAELVSPVPLIFEAADPVLETSGLAYVVELTDGGGTQRTMEVAAPNFFRTDHANARVLAPTGWIRARTGAEIQLDERFETDLEAAFLGIINGLRGRDWPDAEPCFDRLVLEVTAPFQDQPLRVGHECISMAEAMHEDLYFSALEFFALRRGLKPDDRTIRPGQVAPDIITADGPLRIRVMLGGDQVLGADLERTPGAASGLEDARQWLPPAAIEAELTALGGTAYSARSQRGRPVWGRYFEAEGAAASGQGLVISAGQHANETSGTVGALRAARRLRELGHLRFAVSPLENPDGYALFRELVARHPAHMHHAARYTAGGGDLEYMPRGHENEIRYLGRALARADLHLSLHGYPAHEWTRPFSGYVPRGFESWSMPRGFFLILRYQPGWKARGEVILDRIIEDLASYAPIIALNNRQLAAHSRYAGTRDFEVRRGIPVFVREVADQLFPLTIITEAPDETIDGADFIIAHTAQMRVVLAAAAALLKDTPLS